MASSELIFSIRGYEAANKFGSVLVTGRHLPECFFCFGHRRFSGNCLTRCVRGGWLVKVWGCLCTR